MDNEKEIRKIREMASCIKEIIRNEEETYLECNEPLCCHRKILIPLLDFFLSLYGDPWDVERVVPGLNICLQNALRNAMAEKKEEMKELQESIEAAERQAKLMEMQERLNKSDFGLN